MYSRPFWSINKAVRFIGLALFTLLNLAFGVSAQASAHSCATLFARPDTLPTLAETESRWEKFWSFRTPPSHRIENFLPVDADNLKDASIMRGSFPTYEGFQTLQKVLRAEDAGTITRVISFLNNRYDIAQERADLARLGVEFISVPVPNSSRPVPIATIEKILKLMREATPQNKIYIHCRHGQDRTGLLAALYKLRVMNANPREVYDEMLRLGFHRVLLNLVWTWHREVIIYRLATRNPPQLERP